MLTPVCNDTQEYFAFPEAVSMTKSGIELKCKQEYHAIFQAVVKCSPRWLQPSAVHAGLLGVLNHKRSDIVTSVLVVLQVGTWTQSNANRGEGTM